MKWKREQLRQGQKRKSSGMINCRMDDIPRRIIFHSYLPFHTSKQTGAEHEPYGLIKSGDQGLDHFFCMSPLALVVYTFLVFLLYTFLRLWKYINYPGTIPRTGSPGIVGFVTTALKYTLDAEKIIQEGKLKYGDKPFSVPTLSGPVFFLCPDYLDKVRSSTDEVLNEPMTVDNDLQLPYTMDEHQLKNPYQAAVLRKDVNRALPGYIPEMLEETTLAIEDAFRALRTGDNSYEVPVFETMTHLIARISNRVVFGLGLCRNEQFLHAVVRFAETVPLMAPFIKWTPPVLRSITYSLLSSILGGKKEVLRHILPYLKEHFDSQKPLSETSMLVAEHLNQNAPPQETLLGLATRLLNINFGTIHTSSIFITQTLYEIALLGPEAIQDIRQEVQEALESEGGWTKGALTKFKKIDSALREVGRVYGLMYFALSRYTMVEFDLGNGQVVPPGYKVAIDMRAVHFNPEVYPEPERCDLFRFSDMRNTEGMESKYGFATVDANYLPFGAGRHACAGRFFAAMELKMMLAHIILKFDVQYPEGIHARPKNETFDGAIIPNVRAKLVFKAKSP